MPELPNTGLILFSHGSLLCGAGQTLESHAAALRRTAKFTFVEPGYLNYSRPTFQEAAARIAAAGARRVIVTPYFLAPGYFVTTSLPREVEKAKAALPEVEFVAGDPIGFDESLADAILEIAAEARSPAYWREDLRRAALACESRPGCPLFESGVGKADSSCVGRTSERVRPAYRESASPDAEARTALLILVHGSPTAEANDDMFRVRDVIRKRAAHPIVEAGFLECNEPSIPHAAEICAAQGAERIVAVPYFLHTGKHVADDLPTLLEQAGVKHPEIEFRLADFLGRSPRITDILERRSLAALERCLTGSNP